MKKGMNLGHGELAKTDTTATRAESWGDGIPPDARLRRRGQEEMRESITMQKYQWSST